MRKMADNEATILSYAIRLLAKRDYTVADLRQKLSVKHGDVPDEVIQHLIAKRYLDDRRFAEAYLSRRKNRGISRLRQDLAARGIAPELIEEVLSAEEWPSLHDVLTARMVDWKLRAPLERRDAARLFRALARLGYEEDAIREEIDQLHEK